MEENKIQFSYQVIVYENGDVEVVPMTIEGVDYVPSKAEIFEHIRDTARAAELKEVENAAYVGTVKAMQMLAEVERQQ